MALTYSTPQLPWGGKGLSWRLFSTSFKLRALKIKLEAKQNSGHSFLPQWSILFSLEVSTCLPTYLFSPIRWKWYLSCLGAYCVYQCGYFSDLSTGDEFSPSLMSSLAMLNEEKENLLLIARDTQAAVKPLLFTALNKICLWITHTEHCVLLKMLEINIPEINIKHYDVGIPFAIIKQLKIAICLTSAVNTCISYY